ELTGSREVLLQLTTLRPKGLGVLEHNISKLLRDYFLTSERLKSAEQEAAMEKRAWEFLIHQTNERILVLDPDFCIVDANEAFLKAMEKTKEEVVGAKCYAITHGLSAPCSRAHPELGCPLIETLRTGESAHAIHEHALPSFPPFYCEVVTYPLKGADGEVRRVIEVMRDITEEFSSRLEKRIKDMKEDLKGLIQEDRMISLGKLVASSVHEINNPIQGLLTFCGLMQEILEEGEPGPEELEKFKKYLSLMYRELVRCGNIVSGLLSFSRQKESKYRDVDLNEILDQVISLTRHKMEIQNISLKTEYYSQPLVLNGDMNQLQQCFLNLIFNAMEAMPEGGELHVSSELEPSGHQALIYIRDTGCGIPEEDLEHIFDPFFTKKREGQGTGLGLSIVYGVVKNHSGKIKVESQLGKGTTFILSFPLG
ncbi:TPA: PAS domain-containing protein, partial [Candidatus Bathyarchaeota archaeon]|nr:PAS domain-containing protein [Candidatus Bathyarchaeota archaeon]